MTPDDVKILGVAAPLVSLLFFFVVKLWDANLKLQAGRDADAKEFKTDYIKMLIDNGAILSKLTNVIEDAFGNGGRA
jgi:hypothetical protein